MGEVAKPENPVDALPVMWQNTLVIDVALGVDYDTICEAYGLQYPQLQQIMEEPGFKNRLGKLRDDMAKEGVSFRMKAQMQAEEYLKTSFQMVHNEDIDPKVRAKLIGDTVRWAGFDTAANAEAAAGSGISVTINLGNADKAKEVEGRVFDHED